MKDKKEESYKISPTLFNNIINESTRKLEIKLLRAELMNLAFLFSYG